MGVEKEKRLFNSIAPVYGLFYNKQRKTYMRAIENAKSTFDITKCKNVLDVGCGTGALCSVIADYGVKITGVDAAGRMLDVAKRKTGNVEFLHADILEGLPLEDNRFDTVIASYVAHGLERDDRKKLYMEMSRVARNKVVIHDYNMNRSLPTSIVEWLEGGDYFRFIKHAKKEMKDCLIEMKSCFSEVKKVDVSKNAAWYICNPNK